MVYALDIAQKFPAAKFSNFSVILNLLLPLATVGGSLLFLAVILLAGARIITQGESPEVYKKATQTIGFALLGLILVITAFVIVKLIGRILGVQDVLPL